MPPLQNIISNHGTVGPAMQIWVTGETLGVDAEVATWDASQSASKSARLELSWCP